MELKKVYNNYRTISGLLLLALFVGYFISISFFFHSHTVNGAVVVHSHPFSSSDHHSHSTNVLSLIHHISHFLTLAVFAAALFLCNRNFFRIINTYISVVLDYADFKYYLFSRPPPLLF
jgi:hypothetical protein